MRHLACKDCGADIDFVGLPSGGKLPIDPRPTPLGFIVLDENGLAGALDPKHPGRPNLALRYLPHRLTCNKERS